MKNLVEHLSQYANYHRDPRNIGTHFIGIPLIVVAVTVLLSRPGWDVAGMWLSPALLAAAAAVWFYLRLDLRFGLVMGLLLGLCLWVGQVLAVQTTALWLSAGHNPSMNAASATTNSGPMISPLMSSTNAGLRPS